MVGPGDGWSIDDGAPGEYAHRHLLDCIECGAMTVLLPATDEVEGPCLDMETWQDIDDPDLEALHDGGDFMRRAAAVVDFCDSAYNKLPDAEPWAGDRS